MIKKLNKNEAMNIVGGKIHIHPAQCGNNTYVMEFDDTMEASTYLDFLRSKYGMELPHNCVNDIVEYGITVPGGVALEFMQWCTTEGRPPEDELEEDPIVFKFTI